MSYVMEAGKLHSGPVPGASATISASTATSRARGKYAPRACQECRRRRAKCDGQKPSCARCLSRGKPCVFTNEADNRGSAPKSYVDLLQARIKLLEQVLWLHSIDVDASVARLDAQRSDAERQEQGSLLVSGVDGTLAGAYSSSLAFNEMCADIEGALCLDEPLGELDEQPTLSEACFFGASSGRLELQSPLETRTDSLHPDIEPSSSTSDQSPYFHVAHSRRQARSSVEDDILFGIDDLVPPALRDELITLYFEWDQPWFQMVDESLFRRDFPSKGPYSTPLLICSILAVGARYSDNVDARSDPEDPNTAGRYFAERAELLLRSDIKCPGLTTIQALGILGVYHAGVGSDSLGWLYQGMANRLLLDMGLNLDSTAITGVGPLTPAEVRLRRRMYWALYCNDKLWASYTGRVCTMLSSQGAVPLPSPFPLEQRHGGGPDEHALRLQRAMITHCQILEKILTNLYVCSAGQQPWISGDRENDLLMLLGWYYSLPKELKVKMLEGEKDTTPSPHVCLLGMVYHTSVILLSKPFVRHESKAQHPAAMPHPSDHDDTYRRASIACHEAATSICVLAERYREAFGSFRRSPLSATHCTLNAALVLLFVPPPPSVTTTDGTAPRRSDMAHLSGCARTLKELSVSWGPSLRYWRALSKILSGRPPPGEVKTHSDDQPSGITASGRAGAVTRGRRDSQASFDPGSQYSEPTSANHFPPAQEKAESEIAGPDVLLGEADRGLTALDSGLLDVHINHTDLLWAEASAQLPNEAGYGPGYLDAQAFEAISWEQYGQHAPHIDIWNPPGHWQ